MRGAEYEPKVRAKVLALCDECRQSGNREREYELLNFLPYVIRILAGRLPEKRLAPYALHLGVSVKMLARVMRDSKNGLLKARAEKWILDAVKSEDPSAATEGPSGETNSVSIVHPAAELVEAMEAAQ